MERKKENRAPGEGHFRDSYLLTIREEKGREEEKEGRKRGERPAAILDAYRGGTAVPQRKVRRKGKKGHGWRPAGLGFRNCRAGKREKEGEGRSVKKKRKVGKRRLRPTFTLFPSARRQRKEHRRKKEERETTEPGVFSFHCVHFHSEVKEYIQDRGKKKKEKRRKRGEKKKS